MVAEEIQSTIETLHNLKNQTIIVTGGSRGIGRAMVETLLSRGARVIAIAREREPLAEISPLGAEIRTGDVTDAAVMDGVVREFRPTTLILNAGATPHMAPIDEQSWDTFSNVWNNDVKAGLHGIQAALKTPMPPGSRVLIMSSGAAMVLSTPRISPTGLRLSGGYVGAKRMLWLMRHHANFAANERQLDIRFQVLVPLQLIGDTALGHHVAAAYAEREHVTPEAHIAARYGKHFFASQLGELVATFLEDSENLDGVAYGFNGNSQLIRLDN